MVLPSSNVIPVSQSLVAVLQSGQRVQVVAMGTDGNTMQYLVAAQSLDGPPVWIEQTDIKTSYVGPLKTSE